MRISIKSTFFLIVTVAGMNSLHSCKSKTPWNPYLSAKEKPSEKERKEEQKLVTKGTKNWKELKKENKKQILANNAKFYDKKQQYKQTTKIKKRKTKKKKHWNL